MALENPVFGVDLSNYQANLDMSVLNDQGYSFVIAKVTEGAGYASPAYGKQLDMSHKENLLFGAYHFLHSDSPASAQANNTKRHIGDAHIPVVIDCEPAGASKPTLSHAFDYTHACQDLGLTVTILYYPWFWWSQTGRPSFPDSYGFWQALYGPNNVDYGLNLYPGNTDSRWNQMGGTEPDILQFGSKVKIDQPNSHAVTLDANAFRGSLQDLKDANFLYDWQNTPKPPPTPRPKPKPHINETYVVIRKWPSKLSTLSGIADQFHVSVNSIMHLNPNIKDKDKIYPGQKLRVK